MGTRFDTVIRLAQSREHRRIGLVIGDSSAEPLEHHGGDRRGHLQGDCPKEEPVQQAAPDAAHCNVQRRHLDTLAAEAGPDSGPGDPTRSPAALRDSACTRCDSRRPRTRGPAGRAASPAGTVVRPHRERGSRCGRHRGASSPIPPRPEIWPAGRRPRAAVRDPAPPRALRIRWDRRSSRGSRGGPAPSSSSPVAARATARRSGPIPRSVRAGSRTARGSLPPDQRCTGSTRRGRSPRARQRPP